MLVIPVPHHIYLAILCGLTRIWVIWIVTDVKNKGFSKYSLKRLFTYLASGAVIALLWGLFIV